MEATGSYETLLFIYWNIRRYIPKYRNPYDYGILGCNAVIEIIIITVFWNVTPYIPVDQ
jgi:hypothetical protein